MDDRIMIVIIMVTLILAVLIGIIYNGHHDVEMAKCGLYQVPNPNTVGVMWVR